MSSPLIVIAGPTASGKTAQALALAERVGGEVVNADSQQIYERFDIGTAKPSAEELARVPHHLISVIPPMEQCSAARYQALADAAIAEIRARGKRPIVVGGTGLYLRVLLRGVMDAPAAQPELRAKYEAEAREKGRAALHAKLAAVDPASAAAIQTEDLVRIIRALEIYEAGGVTASELRRRHAFAQSRHEHELFVLDPPRESLYATIEKRTAAMFSGGLLDEVKALVRDGFSDAPPMRSVGYAQALKVVTGEWSLHEAIANTTMETRRYAKRQMTWFKKEPGAKFIAPPFGELAV